MAKNTTPGTAGPEQAPLDFEVESEEEFERMRLEHLGLQPVQDTDPSWMGTMFEERLLAELTEGPE